MRPTSTQMCSRFKRVCLDISWSNFSLSLCFLLSPSSGFVSFFGFRFRECHSLLGFIRRGHEGSMPQLGLV